MSKTASFPTPHPVRAIRTGLGLSLREVGVEAAVDFRRMSHIERGFSRDEITRLSKALTRLGGHAVTPDALGAPTRSRKP